MKSTDVLNFQNVDNESVSTITDTNSELVSEEELNESEDCLENIITSSLDESDKVSSNKLEIIIDSKDIQKVIQNPHSKVKHLDAKVIQYQQTQDEDIFDEIYRAYIPKFKYVAFRMCNEDIEQELAITLLNAIKTFRTGANAKFNTYFWACARHHLGVLYTRAWAKKRAQNNFLVSLQKPAYDDTDTELADLIEDPSSEEVFKDINFAAFLENNIFPRLEKVDQFIISQYIQGYTHEEISKLLNTTTQFIHFRFKKMGTRPCLKEMLMSYFGLKQETLVKKIKRVYQRRLTIEEVDELIKARLAYKEGDILLTEEMIYARDGEINATK